MSCLPPHARSSSIDAINGNALTSGGDGGGLLQLLVLGSALGWLYNRSGRRIAMPITAHATYNGAILFLEAARNAMSA